MTYRGSSQARVERKLKFTNVETKQDKQFHHGHELRHMQIVPYSVSGFVSSPKCEQAN